MQSDPRKKTYHIHQVYEEQFLFIISADEKNEF